MTPRPGDIGFCHSKGIIGRAIRLGEWLRFRNGRWWNHVFIVSDETDASGQPLIIQAVARGVTDTAPLTTVAPGGNYEIIPLPPELDRDAVLAFAKSQVGQKYGYLSILSIAVKILLPRWFPWPTVRMGSTWICSALGAESLRAGGWIHSWPDVYDVVPSQVYTALTGVSTKLY